MARAENARGLCFALSGTTIAILTFTLFFLFPQDQAHQVNRIAFHVTLDLLVGGLFFFGLGTYLYSRLMIELIRGSPRVRRTLLFANGCFSLAFAMVNLSPALVLFTIRLYDVAAVAFVLWLILEIVVVRGRDAFEPIYEIGRFASP